MATIINLDALIPEQKYVRLDGKEYPLNFASVEIYLEVLQSRQRIKHMSEEVEQMTQAIELITRCCPDIPQERLKKLPLKALMAVADAIMEQLEDDAVGDLEADEESGERADTPLT